MSKLFGTEPQSPADRRTIIEKTVRQYANLIFLTAYQNLRNYHDAEDILQDVSVALVKENAPLDDDAHLRNWLVMVTLNKCRNHRKALARHNNVPIDDYLELQAPEAREVMEELWQLPENYRSVIYLHYYENFTIAEIAKIMRKSPNTVGSWLGRARKRLKIILTEEEEL